MLFRKVFFPLFAVIFSLLFAACEKDDTNNNGPKKGSELGPCYDDGTCDEGLVCIADVCFKGTVTDDDLITDDLIPEEEPEGEDVDTKTDTDKVDTDKVDIDEADVDETDEDIAGDEIADDDVIVVTGPCAALPCTAVAHSDGTCTNDGETYICGCVENYSWDAENKDCVADTRRTDCGNAFPDNAHFSGDNADGKFEQLWDGDSWEPGSFACAWECDLNYTWVDTACVADTQRTDCVNIPESAHGTGDNSDGKFEQTWDGAAWLPASVICAWECDTNYTINGNEDGCIADTRRTDCENIPANAHGTGDNADGKFPQIWDGSSWVPGNANCAWTCDTNYTLNLAGDACVADTRRTDCENTLPNNAHFSGDNADGKFEQTWDGAAWLPGSVVCMWSCDENYAEITTGSCTLDTQRTNCTNIPANAHGTGDNADGKFEQTWNDATQEWEPALVVCTWECDTNYNDNDENGTCVANTQRTNCTNIPANAHGTGDNADGKFEQTWDGDSWEPATDICTWLCDTNYNDDDENGTCVADTRRIDCVVPSLPENAHWIAPNADGKFEQTWDGDSWEATTTDICVWECDTNYNDDDQNGTCVADTQRVDCTNIPLNAHGIDPNADDKFEQTWDGDSWEATTTDVCVWECDTNYNDDDENSTCVADTRRVDCTNIPDNA